LGGFTANQPPDIESLPAKPEEPLFGGVAKKWAKIVG
jgi:hypothetical protein